jgi:gamma-glutamyl-gamma-aminobutyrate hydrolase PuuD
MHTMPLVGVSGSIESDERKQYILRVYFRSVLKTNAIPVLLSLDMDREQIDACLSNLDGLLLAGGNDLDPMLFGESPSPALKQVDPLRDKFEIALIREAYRLRMPILAICRGLQTLNVALGGTLYQDLPSQYAAQDGANSILHEQAKPSHEPSHKVLLTLDTPLHAVFGKESLKVNSLHHQAIKQLAEPLSVAATAKDGVVEAAYDAHMPFVWGVQWHPERMANGAPLFAAFSRACAAYANGKV